MSIRLMAEAWELPLKGNEKSVLLCLADFANDDGFCFPSWNSILSKCNISKGTLSYVLKSLENQNLIMRFSRKRDNGSNSSNGYQVIKNVWQSSEIELGGKVQKLNYQSSEIELLYEPPYEPPYIKEKKEKEKYFTFTLTKKTSYSNLSALYKQQLEKEINTLQGNMSFEYYVLQLEAKGYKYKNFLSAYKTWERKDKYPSPKQKNTNSVTLEERIEEAERRKQEGIERWEKENGL